MLSLSSEEALEIVEPSLLFWLALTLYLSCNHLLRLVSLLFSKFRILLGRLCWLVDFINLLVDFVYLLVSFVNLLVDFFNLLVDFVNLLVTGFNDLVCAHFNVSNLLFVKGLSLGIL